MLGLDKTIFPTEITVYAKELTEKWGEEIREIPIDIAYSIPDFKSDEAETFSLVPFDVIFILPEIADVPGILERWFQTARQLDVTLEFLFRVSQGLQSTNHFTSTFLQQQFLSIMQALEFYDRQAGHNQELSNIDHEERLNAIFSTAPTEYRSWLQEKLNYSNEPSLRRRLRRLFELTEPLLRTVFNSKSQVKSFENAVILSRNYYTHHDGRLRGKALQSFELLRTTQMLAYILKMCILLELGISSEDCVTLIGRNRSFKSLSRHFEK